MRLIIVAASVFAFASSALAEDVSIQVVETKLRDQPKYYAKGMADLKYGDRVQKLSEDGGWVRVRTTTKKEGFIPLSAISYQKIVLSSKAVSKLDVDTAEVVLAGRGFSKEVEQEYKARDGSARFDLVDQVERSGKLTPAEVQQFVKAGGLQG